MEGVIFNSLHSTFYIEGLWAEIKKLMMKIYGIIPMNNFVYYLREIEMRILIKNFNVTKKMETFKNMMKIVYDKFKFKFSNKNEIEDLNNYDLIFKLKFNFIILYPYCLND